MSDTNLCLILLVIYQIAMTSFVLAVLWRAGLIFT
jgi:hypothetical protein